MAKSSALLESLPALELRYAAERRYGPPPSPVDETSPTEWEAWLRALFPSYTRHPFAAHHAELWEWGWDVEVGVRPSPFVTILARGGAKSTSAEMMAVAWGARKTRRYVWYLSETQDQADDHVGNIASMLESAEISRYYPAMGERLVGKFGNSRGWRRNRLRTASGSFTVDALGLDVGPVGSSSKTCARTR